MRPLQIGAHRSELIFRPCLCARTKRLRYVCGLPESKCSGALVAASSSERHGRALHSVRAGVANQKMFVSRRRAEDHPALTILSFAFENRAVIALGGIRMKQKVKGST